MKDEDTRVLEMAISGELGEDIQEAMGKVIAGKRKRQGGTPPKEFVKGFKSECQVKMVLKQPYNKETNTLAHELSQEPYIDGVVVDREKAEYVFCVKLSVATTTTRQECVTRIISKYQGKFKDFEFVS